jgi:hypothetical protein
MWVIDIATFGHVFDSIFGAFAIVAADIGEDAVTIIAEDLIFFHG